MNNSLLRDRLLANLCAAIGLLGLVLVAIGLYGLLNYSVQRRTREIGVRLALGAVPARLAGAVLKDLALLAAAGLATGTAAGYLLLRLLDTLLFGLDRADPRVFAAALAVFGSIALVAGAIPARRAARVDPLTALRHD